jgi:ribonuclease HII
MTVPHIKSLDNLALSDEIREKLNTQLVNAVESSIQTLVFLSKHAQNEKTRLDASKTIIDRVMGKVPDKVQIDAMAPVREFLNGIIVDAEVSAIDAEHRAFQKAEEIKAARAAQRAHLPLPGNPNDAPAN